MTDAEKTRVKRDLRKIVQIDYRDYGHDFGTALGTAQEISKKLLKYLKKKEKA